MARPTKQELDYLTEVNLINGTMVPNVVTDIYKVRSGQWTQVRIWSYVDLGTLRKQDLFVTDNRFQSIEVVTHDKVYSREDEGLEESVRELLNSFNDRLQSIS